MRSDPGRRFQLQWMLWGLRHRIWLVAAAAIALLLMVVMAPIASRRHETDIFSSAQSDNPDVLCHHYGDATVCGPAPPPMRKYRQDLRERDRKTNR